MQTDTYLYYCTIIVKWKSLFRSGICMKKLFYQSYLIQNIIIASKSGYFISTTMAFLACWNIGIAADSGNYSENSDQTILRITYTQLTSKICLETKKHFSRTRTDRGSDLHSGGGRVYPLDTLPPPHILPPDTLHHGTRDTLFRCGQTDTCET